MILLLVFIAAALVVFAAMVVIILGSGFIEARLLPEQQGRPPRHQPR